MKSKTIDLTTGNEMKSIILFSLPLIAGNLFQQLYVLVDTVIVGKFIGANALAAVGSSYMTMNFLTSIIIGLCMGSGIVFSFFYGSKNLLKLGKSFFQSFIFILGITIIINGISFLFIDSILKLLNISEEIFAMTRRVSVDYIYRNDVCISLQLFCGCIKKYGKLVYPACISCNCIGH